MKRTQLNFDEKTYYQLVSYAQKKNTSISGAVRTLVSRQLNHEVSNKDHPLLGLVELGKKFKVKGPRDLSAKIDYYLYGEGNPKFSSRKR